VLPEGTTPTNTSPPTIIGTPQQGMTLTEQHGSWTHEPTSYTYQWQQCNSEGNACAPISGATGQTYVPVAADVGHTLRVQETASNAVGTSNPATSAATPPMLIAPPANTSPPTISGTAQQGQTLTEAHGSWTNEPTSFNYQWQQCNAEGNSCTAISGATGQTYVPVAGDVGHTLRLAETASNAGGSSEAATSPATSAVAPPVPGNTSPPTITGTAQQGQILTEQHGVWTNEPTSFTYQWQQCDVLGNGCLPISGATAQTYVPVAGDVGHALRVQETASNGAGSSEPATSAATSAVAPPVPGNTSPPTITGTAQQGQTLTEQHGVWTNEPTGFTYQWQQCDGLGNSCLPISGAAAQTYVPVAGDVGHALRVQETASNAGGSGSPATSSATSAVAGTFGKTTVGTSSGMFSSGRKRVNHYAFGTAGSVAKLTIYLAPTGKTSSQVMKGIIYADAGGAASALLGVSEQLTFIGTGPAGWYDLRFATPVKLTAGTYWIGVLTGGTSNVAGFRYGSVSRSRDYNTNTYTSGPSNPFGTPSVDSQQMSLYATYTSG
jgi:hypothetical protein